MARQFRRCSILLAVATAAPSFGQQTQPSATPEQTAELERARTIITDINASAEVRRIGAEDLLRLRSPAAMALATEILRGRGDSLPQVAVCEAIAAIGGREPALLDPSLVEPLLELLASPETNVPTKAAIALASFRDGNVAVRLGALAADQEAPIVRRLAAVDALALNVAQRPVVEQLVRLLDTDDGDLRRQVIAALRPAARVDYGMDLDRWRQWWASKRSLDETGWLLDRVELLTRQTRELQATMAKCRAEQERREGSLARRLAEELAARYRLTPQPQKNELLIQWLADPLVDYRRAALSLVRANISDNNPPSAAVRVAMRRLFADESAELRRAVFDVIAALTDPADAEPVHTRLAQETDPAVREAILRTLGRLQNPIAIEALTAELADADAPAGCVTEAAASLGMLAALGTADPAAIAPGIAPLKRRFAATPPEAVQQRAVLLQAMANIASTEFAPEFLANLDAAEPDLLLSALAGLRAIGDASRIDRILTLVSHQDPRVRRRAIRAVAGLDGESAHLEALFHRLSPAVEPDESVRQAAWEGFGAMVAKTPPEVRLQWTDRLEELPERQEAYLAALVADLADESPQPVEFTEARLRLATLYDGQERYAEALPLWRNLHETFTQTADARAEEAGLSLLQATLETGRYEGLDELLTRLVADLDPTGRDAMAGVVLDHLEAALDAPESPDIVPLLDSLDRLPADTFDAAFHEAVQAARASLAPTEPHPTTAPAETP